MAQGDFTLFNEFTKELGDEVHDFAADTFKLGIVTSGVTPASTDATPRWGDYSANEVSTAGNYTANGETLTATTFAESAGVSTFDAADVTIAQSTAGFTNAYWGVLYNDTATNDEAIGFIDLGGPVSEQSGNVTVSWNASGIFTISITT